MKPQSYTVIRQGTLTTYSKKRTIDQITPSDEASTSAASIPGRSSGKKTQKLDYPPPQTIVYTKAKTTNRDYSPKKGKNGTDDQKKETGVTAALADKKDSNLSKAKSKELDRL